MIIKRESAKVTVPVTGITRRLLAHTDQVMLTEHELEKGAVLPEHNHPHEQLVYLISGKLLLEMGEEKIELNPGDSAAVPSNLNHKAVALEKSVALDIFSPARKDYL